MRWEIPDCVKCSIVFPRTHSSQKIRAIVLFERNLIFLRIHTYVYVMLVEILQSVKAYHAHDSSRHVRVHILHSCFLPEAWNCFCISDGLFKTGQVYNNQLCYKQTKYGKFWTIVFNTRLVVKTMDIWFVEMYTY